jgi:hypothetical protein
MVTGELLFDPKGEEERDNIQKYNKFYKIRKKPVERKRAAINLPKDMQKEYDEDKKCKNNLIYYGDCDDTNEEDPLEEEKDEQNEQKNKNGDNNNNTSETVINKKTDDKKNQIKSKTPCYDRDEDHLSLFICHLSPFSKYLNDERCV